MNETRPATDDDTTDDAAATKIDESSSTVGRRGVLRRLSALVVGAAAGAVLVRPDAAGATTGAMQFGTGNDAGTAPTALDCSTDSVHASLSVNNNGTGYSVVAEAQGSHSIFASSGGGTGTCVEVLALGDGAGVRVTRENTAVAGAAVDATSQMSGPVYRATSQPQCGEPLYVGTHNGFGAGMQLTLTSTTSSAHVIDANQAGKGGGMVVNMTNAANSSPGVKVTTAGTGPAVYGSGGTHGRGATFISNVAQIRLAPGTLASHPTSGSPGDLYVDKSARLWYCKSATAWHQIA